MHMPVLMQVSACTAVCCWQVDDVDNIDDPPSMSLANGIDFGVLSRVPLLAQWPLTQLETMVLSNIRLYHLVIKVHMAASRTVPCPPRCVIRIGQMSQVSNKYLHNQIVGLQGNLIFFPHDAPRAMVNAVGQRLLHLDDRLDWLLEADVRIALVGEDGCMDNLAQWLMGKNVIRVRPDVCMLHLRVRHALDDAMGNAHEIALPSEEHWPSLAERLRTLPDELLKRAQRIGGTAAAAERLEQVNQDDVSKTRSPEAADEMSAMALLSSSTSASALPRVTLQSMVDAMQTSAGQRDVDGTSGSSGDGGEDGSGDGTSGSSDGGDEGGNGEGASSSVLATAGATSSTTTTTPDPLKQVTDRERPAHAARSKSACNEFVNNGLHLMHLFRHLIPLMRVRVETKDDGTQRKLTWPLKAHGTLSVVQRRHLLTQFTNLFSNSYTVLCVLGNQTQRHAVVGSVAAMAKTDTFSTVVQLMSSEKFWKEVQYAMDNLESDETRKLLKKLLPLFAIVGKDKPWGKFARGAFKAKILGVSERHGFPSFFVTVSLDDAHQLISIRLSFANMSNEGFPSYADANHLNEGARRRAAEQKTDADVTELLRALRMHETRTFNTLKGDMEFTFDEATFQRLANQNAVATTLLFEKFVTVFLQVLVGLPASKQRRKTIEMLDVESREPSQTAPADANARRSSRVQERASFATKRASAKRGEKLRQQANVPHMSGFMGVCTAHVGVTEESSRKALHEHHAFWTSLSPRLLSKYAADPIWRAKLITAIESMVQAHVPWEVHAVQAANKALKKFQPRVSLQPWPSTLAEARKLTPVFALQLGEHSEHHATCAIGKSGQIGCRSMFDRPHGFEKSRMLQVESVDTVDPQLLQTELAADNGNPEACVSGCTLHWPTEDCDKYMDMLHVVLLRPQPWTEPTAHITILPNGSKIYSPLLPRDPRVIVFEMARPEVRLMKSPAVLRGDDSTRQTARALQMLMDACAPSDAAAARQVVAAMVAFKPVQVMLNEPPFGALRLALTSELTDETAVTLVRTWKGMTCRNSIVLDWSEILTMCSKSNTAPYPLGVGNSAASALFYLVKCARCTACRPSKH